MNRSEKRLEIERKSKKLINEAKMENYTIGIDKETFLEQSWQDIAQIAQNENKIKRRKQILKYCSIPVAASLLGIVVYFFLPNLETEKIDYLSFLVDNNGTVHQNICLYTENKIIELENNATVTYTKSGMLIIDSKTKVKENINVKNLNINKIIAPKGKQVQVELSEGTLVRLNAGSKFVFPTVFGDDTRIVAVEGEAFFDVKKDTSRPFIVNMKDCKLKVLGTSFCARRYEDENFSYILLLEGSVEVATAEGNSNILSKNQMANINTDGTIEIKKVDPDQYTSWLEHKIIIPKSETVEHLVSRLSHHYGVAIDVSSSLKQRPIEGKIILEDDVQKVLSNLALVLNADFVIEENRYVLY